MVYKITGTLFIALLMIFHVDIVEADNNTDNIALKKNEIIYLAKSKKKVGVGHFYGKWTSTEHFYKLVLKPGGRWESVSSDKRDKKTGRWKVEHTSFIWHYDNKPSAPDEINIIVDVSDDRFILKKLNGRESEFIRIKE